jgi:hypothetical protein
MIVGAGLLHLTKKRRQPKKDYVYYESIKREPKIRGIYECRCDERLQTKPKKFTRLPYTFFFFLLLFIMNR